MIEIESKLLNAILIKLSNHGLTYREKSVAVLWIQGCDYRTISKKLFISEHTTRTIIKNIYKKLEVNSKIVLLMKILAE
ncbi:LuxR family transcriptional regulator [Xylanibacillus composti]|uniref:HTH luxR-type domain-containing protein n=1 Tax=Xylanibacillus composti TaxID=1572762 RepID=A0A8J4M0C2_9BACL|nr:LuxR family transcriptional regulator [Xylanibacillus composti]GIQ67294.1 hypothetical protein XYCOK13_01180 [Xylanibacillus composti]